MNELPYRGRFAPTPSGPLHFGSLVAALGSFLDARAHAGEWLLRIEDVDPPRVVAGATEAILRGLDAFGFEWDGPVESQSRRGAAYQAALDRLDALGLVYGCHCSRKEIAEVARRGVDGPVYPGTCRALGWRGDPAREPAWRLRVPETRVEFDDRLLGRVACDIARECGDCVLKRADGVFTYQLAVVVDDAERGITHVVRGADLLASTPRQIVLQRALGYPTPVYLHLPVVLDAAGDKLSKQTLAAPIEAADPLPALLAAARFLGQAPVPEIGSPAEFWDWAKRNWRPERLPRLRARKLAG
ncbi:MAG: tRNA glutamyl-Q(34) synthetase GluQRS [Betaproteobacteria bacterium]|nr:tRNA glutamyl-Q(34) synthetase GluQRS [Betaproteobacteria bacterium]